MSIFALMLPGGSGTPAKSSATGQGARYIKPTLNLGAGEPPQSQPDDKSQPNVPSQRFYLPSMLDPNDVSYKILVPGFGSLPPLGLCSKYISDLIKIDAMIPGDLYADKNLNMASKLDNYCFEPENVLPDFKRFEKVSQIDLPDRFFDEYNLAQTLANMGLFPEVKRAWIAVDNKLVLWNYTLPASSFNKMAQFLTLGSIKHSILTVKLLAPKPKVFVPEVNHLLLVATTMDIHLYVVKYDAATNNLDIFNPNLSVSAQGLIANKFAFNEVTRDVYFACHGDGTNVWRLDYSTNASFSSNKCDKVCLTKSGLSSVLPLGKITHLDMFASEHTDAKDTNAKKSLTPEFIQQLEVDPHRNFLYSVSNKSVIRVYKLSDKQELFPAHAEITPKMIYRAVSQIFVETPNIKSFSTFRIVNILVVPPQESANVHLIATTNFGNRILLRVTASSPMLLVSSQSLRFAVVTMKFPPTKDVPQINPELDSFTKTKQYVALLATSQQNSEILKGTKVVKIISPGVFIAVTKTEESDRLFVSLPNYGFLKRSNKLVEDAEFIDLAPPSAKGSTPIFVHDIVQLTPSMNASDKPSGYANILAAQYTKQPLQFAVLTNFGISIYQYRTSDQLVSSLRDEALDYFREENGNEEMCSTLLYLLCDRQKNTIYRKKALSLFSYVGNNARFVESLISSLPHVAMKSDPQPLIEQVVLSDRFYGTCLLIARLFRNEWETKVFAPLPHIKMVGTSVDVTSIKEDNLLIQGLAVSRKQVEFFIGSVVVLLDFFNENVNEIPGLNAPAYSSDPSKIDNELCMRAEHIAFTSIVRSLALMKEALLFLMILIEETQSNALSMPELFKFLAPTNQLNLLTLTFRDLILPKPEVKDLIRNLLSSVINKNILKGGSIDLIASLLKERCGLFCSTDDVFIFKAIENLTRAKNIGNRDTELKSKCLNNAVELFLQASDSLTLENIESSVNIMLQLEFYTGAVDFLLKLSKRYHMVPHSQKAIANAAITSQIHDHTKMRLFAYDSIFKILTDLDVKAVKVLESNNQLLINDVKEMRDTTYDACFASTEQAFHEEFYKWFINQGSSERLLSVETPFIEPFLEKAAQDNLALSELLWLYHAKREHHLAAARILYSLAILEFHLTLLQRIEALSRANGFCNSTCPPSVRQEMIYLAALIRDLFEVANVQLDLLNLTRNDSRISRENKEAAEQSLNHKIQSASELFNSYADPLGYYEICFSIFQISNYKNQDDILKRWELFFERIFHDFVVGKGGKPFYTLVGEALTAVGPRVANNDIVFPVGKLIKLVCKYIENAIDEGGSAQEAPAGVIVDMFLRSGVLYEKLYVSIRSLLVHNSCEMHAGFTRLLESTEMVYLIKKWFGADKKLKEVVDASKIAAMTLYKVKEDPLEKWAQAHSSVF